MWKLLAPVCCLALWGCSGDDTDVGRILTTTLGLSWHQWAQIADMDGDGNSDIVTASHVLDSNRADLNVFVWQPDGSYQKQRLQLGSQPSDRVSHLLVQDLNLDGLPDAVVSHVGFTAAGSTPGRIIRVLLKSGLGPVDFESATAYPVGDNPIMTAAGDVDLDGLADIAVATGAGVDLLIQEGGNPGRFLAPRRIIAGPSAGVVIADMDRDGLPDLLSADENGVRLFLNDRNDPGRFPASSLWPVSSWPCGLVTGDFNGDGWLDFATCHATSDAVAESSVSQRLQDPLQPGTFTARTDIGDGQALSLSSIASADLNGDNREDLVLAVTDGLDGVSLAVHLAGADGIFGGASYFRDGAVSGPWSASLGQLGPDDRLDAVLAHALDGVYVQEGNGDGTFQVARKVGE